MGLRTTVRDCFNTERDHEAGAAELISALDIESRAAGYDLSEYADALQEMLDAIRQRMREVKVEVAASDR